MKIAKVLGVLSVLCITVLGLLLAFGLMTTEKLTEHAAQILGGVGVLFVSGILLSLIGGGGNSTDKTDPPPTL